MFTGIIQAVTPIKQAKRSSGSLFLTIQKPPGWKLKAGDSVATNGVCLTVKKQEKLTYLTELSSETLARTSFRLQLPITVNVERPLRLADLISGHLVLGHVDTVGKIIAISKQRSPVYTISLPKKFQPWLVEKGSVAVDGISLTVVDLGKSWFTVVVVDYTLRHTTLGQKNIGDAVNLEFDVIGKYIRQLNKYAS